MRCVFLNFQKYIRWKKRKFARIIRTHPGKTTQQKKTRNINAACASQKLHLLFVGSYNYLAAAGVEVGHMAPLGAPTEVTVSLLK